MGAGDRQGGNTIETDSPPPRLGEIQQILNILSHFAHIFRLGVFIMSLHNAVVISILRKHHILPKGNRFQLQMGVRIPGTTEKKQWSPGRREKVQAATPGRWTFPTQRVTSPAILSPLVIPASSFPAVEAICYFTREKKVLR